MKRFSLTLLYILVLFALLQNWLWLAIGLAFLGTVFGSAWPLMCIGILIDGYFGHFHSVPLWSLLFLLWYVVSEMLRPQVIDFKASI